MTIGSVVRSGAGALLRGALLGFGFAFGFGLLYLLAWPMLDAEMDQRLKQTRIEWGVDPDDVLLSEVEEIRQEDGLAIIGKATNTSERIAGELYIDVDLFGSGKLVDKCRGVVFGILKPGEFRYFKIVCSHGASAIEHDSFKVTVLGDS